MQTNGLSQLLARSNTSLGYADDIRVFACEEEGDKDKSTFSSEFALAQNCQDFIRAEYNPVDQVLPMQEVTSRNLHVNQVPLDELAFAQLRDMFCSKTNHSSEWGEGLAFCIDHNWPLVQAVQFEPQINILYSLEQLVLILNHRPLLAAHRGGRKLYYRIKHHFY